MTEDLDPGLDPQLADLLRKQRTLALPELYTLSPQDARAAYEQSMRLVRGKPPAIETARDVAIDTTAGSIRTRLYYPCGARDGSLPMLVYFHGGGWCFGSIESHDHICRALCARSRCLVASVDYHLSPEHKFPRAVDDALAAVEWAARHAEALGADPARLVVGGDSAGANLATVATLAMRGAHRPRIHCQMLIYPATDMTMSHPSHRLFAEGLRLTRPLMVWCLANYLRDGTDMLHPMATPLLATEHASLPPALIFTAGFDPLRDEGAAYADKLRAANVPVRYRCFDTLIHGFLGLTGVVDAAAAALDEIALTLHRELG